MTISEFQSWLRQTTCLKSSDPTFAGIQHFAAHVANTPFSKEAEGLYYMTGLAEEVGELTALIRKALRSATQPNTDRLCSELGDIQSWLCRVANLYDIDMNDVVSRSITKLESKLR